MGCGLRMVHPGRRGSGPVQTEPDEKRGHVALIPVEKAQIGMLLSEAVHDRRGRLLMPAGRELTEKHLDALPMWGVRSIQVEGEGTVEDEDPLDQLMPWAVARAGEEVAHLFLHAGVEHPAMKELSALAVRRRAIQLQKEESHDH